jgi:molybdate transport system substrate-binding protein
LIRGVFAGLLALALTAPAGAQTPAHVALFAAGSLRPAMTELARTFTAQTGIAIDPTYGSSGLLRTQIESGANYDIFASADTASPQQLSSEGKSGPVTVFAHNAMCLLVKPAIAAGRAVAAIVLDPAVRLVTSTPKADPAGDYAEQIFTKIDASRPGSLVALDAKALRLIGGKDAVAIPAGADLGTYLLLTANQGDALLAYCSGFVTSVAANPAALQSLPMPAALAVRADYGLTLRPAAAPAAMRWRDFILSAAGQAILEKYGFTRA